MRTLVIDAAALARNLDRLRRAASARIIGVVKGNGYGLGLTDYARFLTEHGVDMLAVSTAEEAAALRQAGIAAEVLMLSSTAVPRDVAVLLDCGAILTVGSCAAAETVSAVAVEKGVTARVHVKLDTGMGRFGFLPQDVTEAAALLKSLPSMRVEGVFTHFANTTDEALTRRQYQQFQEGAALLERAGIETGLRHVCASSAFLRYPEMQLDAVRLGSALLGRLSVPDPLGLEKIGWLETQVMELKDLPSGWKVGYTGAYRTKRPTRLALLPAGYTSGVGVTEESNALRLRLWKPKTKPVPSAAGTAAEHIADNEEELTMKKTVTIEGMMCAHCVAHVEKALTALPGVKATVDLTSGTAVVEGDVTDEAIRAAVTDAGYTVKGIQ